MTSPDSVLHTVFGFDAFRPGQADIIETILDGQNILAVMPTGAGKSLCYQVPGLILERPTVIISPLVALMDNQVAGLRAQGVSVACLHSGQTREENIDEWRSVTHGNAKLLYMSPERLMSGRMLAAMRALNPGLFVVDEAHCVSKWGPAFRPEYAQLADLKSIFPNAVIAAFTATADAATREDIAQTLFSGRGKMVVQGFDRPNLDLTITPKVNRNGQLMTFMNEMRGQSGIVYCLSRKLTEQTAEMLAGEGFTALPYHAGLSPEVRFNNQERFMAEEAVVIVATIAFGMGIDKPDIRFVFHMNLPGSLEAYYQEIGRAGRDGAPASTSMLYGLDDVRMRRQFISDDGSESDHQMREHKRLDALLAYCEASSCRRQVLLTYFGEEAQACGNCDNCLNPPKLVDASGPARALFDAVAQTGERFGTAHVIDVVRGADTARIRQFGHDKTPVYGMGKAMGKPYLQALIRQAVSGGFLTLNIAQYGALQLKGNARDVMAGHAPFMCKEINTTAASSKSPGGKSGRKSKHAALAAELSDRDSKLLAALKSRRMELSKQLGKPAYVVFSDATLIDMAKKRPNDRDGMLNVLGVGAVKFERFGTEFLRVVAEG